MAGVLGLGARLSKLRAMSAGEILHRLRYKATLEIERRQHRANRRQEDPRRRARLLDARRRAGTRFFASVHEREAIAALFDGPYAAERADTVAKAAEARQHRFSFFGAEFAYGDEIPWHADPVTGREWPHVYHADVPVHGGDVGFGDVKHVWELSRHQFLIDLGKSWFLTRNAGDLAAMRSLVRSWIADNPYGTGVNWSCALEPAFRVFSWLWAYSLTADALDDDFHAEWLASFQDHGRFIDRHFEHYSSPYNHLIGEAAALYMLGACLPELDDAGRWRSAARNVLTTRLPEQFYADGGSVEQSTFYHHATVGFYLLAGLTSKRIGDELPREIWSAIERGLDCSLSLTQPDGRTPSIGGADDGKPIRMQHLPFWDFRPYLSIGAVVFGRPDFKAASGRFYEDALWLLGTEGLRAFEALPSQPPASPSRALPASGYWVLRSDWSPAADYVCVDCGEQAAGMRTDAVPNSMHGHADCLSLVASLGGRPVLADSGFYSYNAGGEWEAHFRETAAHSTITVDGRDQARHLGKMAWSHSYRATAEAWHADRGESWMIGSHDGYARGAAGVRHRRTVWLRPGAWLVVHDQLTGAGAHTYEANFQFAPGTLRDLGGDLAGDLGGDLGGIVCFDDAVDVMWASADAWTARMAAGGPGPADGWIAPSLGIRVPAPRLTLTCSTGAPPVQLLVVLAHRAGGGAAAACAALEQACHAHQVAAAAGARPDFAAIGDLAARLRATPSQP